MTRAEQSRNTIHRRTCDAHSATHVVRHLTKGDSEARVTELAAAVSQLQEENFTIAPVSDAMTPVGIGRNTICREEKKKLQGSSRSQWTVIDLRSVKRINVELVAASERSVTARFLERAGEMRNHSSRTMTVNDRNWHVARVAAPGYIERHDIDVTAEGRTECRLSVLGQKWCGLTSRRLLLLHASAADRRACRLQLKCNKRTAWLSRQKKGRG